MFNKTSIPKGMDTIMLKSLTGSILVQIYLLWQMINKDQILLIDFNNNLKCIRDNLTIIIINRDKLLNCNQKRWTHI